MHRDPDHRKVQRVGRRVLPYLLGILGLGAAFIALDRYAEREVGRAVFNEGRSVSSVSDRGEIPAKEEAGVPEADREADRELAVGLHGVVVDRRTGLPIKGAKVEMGGHGAPLVALTNHRGVFDFADLGGVDPGAEDLVLRASASGYCSGRLVLGSELSRSALLRLSLWPVSTLTGHVIASSTSRPVADARVQVVADRGSRRDVDLPSATRSDRNGFFELKGVPAHCPLVFRARSESAVGAQGLFLLESEEYREVRLEAAVSVRGQVVDSSGNGRSGLLLIGSAQLEGNGAPRTRTDEDGWFRFEGLPLPPWNLSVYQESPELLLGIFEFDSLEEIQSLLRLELIGNKILRGRVEGLGGVVDDAQVEVFTGGEVIGRASCRVAGQFAVELADMPETCVLIWGRLPTDGYRVSAVQAWARGQEELVIPCTVAQTTDLRFEIDGLSSGSLELIQISEVLRWIPAQSEVARSVEQGSVTIPHVECGHYRVRVRNGEGSLVLEHELVVEPGDSTIVLDVTERILQGIVKRRGTGEAVVSAEVELKKGRKTVAGRTVSAADGSFTFTVPWRAGYSVRAHAPGFVQDSPCNLEGPEEPVFVLMDVPGEVEVEGCSPDMRLVLVRYKSGQTKRHQAVERSENMALFEAVPPGLCWVVADGVETSVEVRAGQRTRVTVYGASSTMWEGTWESRRGVALDGGIALSGGASLQKFQGRPVGPQTLSFPRTPQSPSLVIARDGLLGSLILGEVIVDTQSSGRIVSGNGAIVVENATPTSVLVRLVARRVVGIDLGTAFEQPAQLQAKLVQPHSSVTFSELLSGEYSLAWKATGDPISVVLVREQSLNITLR